MGMFDNIRCLAALPLNEELSRLDVDWGALGFQTKCLDNYLGSFEITKDGELVENVIEREYIEYTPEELKTLKPKPWYPYKEVKIKNEYTRKKEYHGSVIFYDSLDYSDEHEIWVEFEAFFNYGKLDKITLVKAERVKSQILHNKEFAAREAEKAKKPWSRFKALLEPFGWRRFWFFMAKQCSNSIELLGKIQTFIYRKMT